ncbi:MAG: GNAT family N-acetyltransferase [Defluviitaleaceae bacterium]|nr:GNAT family N-acetyltransferase [Defluviitaleaceae bacterium]
MVHEAQGLDAYFLPPKIALPSLEISGGLRVAGAADMPLVREWIEDFYKETLHTKPPDTFSREDELTARQTDTDARIPEHPLLFVWGDGASVAMGMLAPSEKSSRINLIYVAPEFRGRGYGRAVVAALSQKARESGRVPILYASRGNTAAIRLYKSLGFTRLKNGGKNEDNPA